MPYAVPIWPQPSLPIEGSELLFPVRRIWCVGRNYAAHAREMGHDPSREAPFFFQKPADALVPSGSRIPYPPATADLHHEVELVVAIGTAGREIAPEAALGHVYGYAVGIDLTRRDLQAQAKSAGRPWEMGKAFDQSAPCSRLATAERMGHPSRARITVSVNGATRQDADIADMIWSVPEVIAHLSQFVELMAGDIIFTGTPEGVAAIAAGDVLSAHVDGIGTVEVTIG